MKYKTYKIKDLINEISMGPFGSNIKVECFVESGIPVLNGSNLTGFALNDNSFRYVTPEKADSLGKANAYRGDVVITHRGTLGQIVFIPENSKYSRYVISQSQFRVKCNEKILPEYLVYYFHTNEGLHKLLSNASQVGVPALARASTTFQTLEIDIPEVTEQRKIVDLLETIREKIELNNAINNNLEHQAVLLFKKWFVNFECTSEKTIKTKFGTIPNTFKLLKNSELPVIVTDYVANGSFASLKANVTLYSEPNYAYFIRNTDLKAGTFEVFVDEHSYNFLSKSKLYGGEIIISNVGDVGSVFLCPKLNKPMTLGNNIIMLRPEQANLQYYLYIWFKWLYGQSLIQGIKGGSAQPKFNKTDFKNLPIYLPPDDLLEHFHLSVKPMFELIAENNIENQRLSILRDTLLPKLMSGELDVSDIDL